MKIKVKNDRRVIVSMPKIGDVSLSHFSDNFDNGIYRDRPWHVTTFGRNFATVQECVAYLKEVEAKWDDPADYEFSPVCHAEMTHSFLSTEASLDACPW